MPCTCSRSLSPTAVNPPALPLFPSISSFLPQFKTSNRKSKQSSHSNIANTRQVAKERLSLADFQPVSISFSLLVFPSRNHRLLVHRSPDQSISRFISRWGQ